MVQTQVGALLYRPEALNLQYQVRIEAGMEHLEFHNYDAVELANFKAMVLQEARQVLRGAPAFARKVMLLPYLGQSVSLNILSVNDERNYRLEAGRRNLAVSNGQLPRMLWANALVRGSGTAVRVSPDRAVADGFFGRGGQCAAGMCKAAGRV